MDRSLVQRLDQIPQKRRSGRVHHVNDFLALVLQYYGDFNSCKLRYLSRFVHELVHRCRIDHLPDSFHLGIYASHQFLSFIYTPVHLKMAWQRIHLLLQQDREDKKEDNSEIFGFTFGTRDANQLQICNPYEYDFRHLFTWSCFSHTICILLCWTLDSIFPGALSSGTFLQVTSHAW